MIRDPFNGNTYPVTSDQQTVGGPFFGLSLSMIVQVYNPADL